MRKSGVNMTSGNNNTFVGSNAGRETTISAGGNHFFGDNAGKKATVSGGQNHFIGDHAGQSATVAGARNTFLGNSAGWNADVRSGADGNVFIGQSAGKKDHGTTTGGYISGDLNVFLGHAAGRTAKVSGHYNTFIGAGAGDGQPISGNGGTYIKGSKIEIKANDVVIKSGAGGVKCAWNEYLRGFDGNGKLCGVRATIGTCPSGQVLSGFNADGTLNCVATGGTGWKQTCPVGDVLRGFNSAGNKVCALQDKCNAGYYWSGSRCITRCGSSQRWNHERATCVAYTPPPSPLPPAGV